MITVYTQANGLLRRAEFPADGRLPPDTVWLDLLEPTAEEERIVEQALNIEAPTREEMQEIEASSRIYREGEASYLTVSVIYQSDTPTPGTTAITFIRTPQRLVTKRFAEPQALRSFISRSMRQPAQCGSADLVLTGLLDAIVDRLADILERVAGELDKLSREVFASRRGKTRSENGDEIELEDVVRNLGRMEDLTSRVSDSLISILRVVSFLGQALTEEKAAKDARQRVKTLARDVTSLSEHAAFIAHKANFVLDATLGLINIQQSNIIKIFSVAAVVFMPPTLVASIYGMNFEFMPELHWVSGYPFALALMIIAAILPYWYFKRRGWL